MIEIVNIENIYNDKNVVFIDVRSPKEYLEDHIINAINMPVLTDEERHDVGYTYKNESKGEAVRKGIRYASYKILDYYDEVDRLCREGNKVVFYCFRGGMRSTSVAKTMDALNRPIYLLKGGYKEYRKYVRDCIEEIPNKYEFIMLHGLTGVGKTKILTMLKENGEDVIDLECLARHKGSAFGRVGYDNPTTQRFFESELVYELSRFKGNKVYIESESPKVGNIVVPVSLFRTMKDGVHLLIQTSIKNRIKIILDDYLPDDSAKIYKFNEDIIGMLLNLKKALGKEKVNILIEYINNGNYEKFTEELLIDYYDPLYANSIKNYEYTAVIDYENIEDAVKEIIEKR
ncbi:MAG TPA: tRNA 2-selenouridine(34) synthase MnmH [Clostridiales bacterium]|nr:tRNA 2-selenouridine(34) synthase MnmH [Clostridiales bacterium]